MKKAIYEFDYDNKTVNMQYNENGRKKNKIISINSFVESVIAASELKAFNKGKVVKEYGEMYYENDNTRLIQTIKEGEDTYVYIVQFLPKRMPITIYDTFYDDVGLPNTLFAIRVSNNIYRNGGVVCVKDKCVTKDSEIYYYPYSNASSNHICWGQNKISNILNAKTVLDIPKLFYTMPNTSCSFMCRHNRLCLEYRDLIKYTQGKDFDDNLLVYNNKINIYSEWIKEV